MTSILLVERADARPCVRASAPARAGDHRPTDRAPPHPCSDPPGAGTMMRDDPADRRRRLPSPPPPLVPQRRPSPGAPARLLAASWSSCSALSFRAGVRGAEDLLATWAATVVTSVSERLGEHLDPVRACRARASPPRRSRAGPRHPRRPARRVAGGGAPARRHPAGADRRHRGHRAHRPDGVLVAQRCAPRTPARATCRRRRRDAKGGDPRRRLGRRGSRTPRRRRRRELPTAGMGRGALHRHADDGGAHVGARALPRAHQRAERRRRLRAPRPGPGRRGLEPRHARGSPAPGTPRCRASPTSTTRRCARSGT